MGVLFLYRELHALHLKDGSILHPKVDTSMIKYVIDIRSHVLDKNNRTLFQRLEYHLDMVKVTGSIPVRPTKN